MSRTMVQGIWSRGWPVSRDSRRLNDAERLATLLDDAFRIPGTDIKFGWDSIVGLIPGIGDAATTLAALVPVAIAWKLGAGRWLLTKMLLNVGVDAAIGSIPILGDVFDLFFRANRRNAELLRSFTKGTSQSPPA